MRRQVLIGIALVILMGLGFASNYLYNSFVKPLPIAADMTYQILPGNYLYAVLNDLEKKKLIKSAQIARWYAKFAKLENIKAGEFLIKPGTNLIDLITIFNSDDVIQYRITLVEGNRFEDYLLKIQSEPKIKAVIHDWTNEQIMAAIGAKETHPEGLFAPETYSYTAGQSDLEILIQAYQRQQRVLQDAWSKKSDNSPLKTPYEALILASIVEKETGAAEERAAIAGVFSRRLELGMRLQSDPTTIYGLGDRYNGNLKSKHLREKNQYNTYKISGLPVTPIANPGAAAIYASTLPEAGSSIYFVAKGDGSHYFSSTLKEHNGAVRKYQIYQRSKSYQSNPEEVEPNE